MAFVLANNPDMDTLTTISNNLSAWMKDTPGLGTLEEVAAASGVGFGTVRRIKKCQINPTIKSLELIAAAFKKTAVDILCTNEMIYAVKTTKKPLTANEKKAPVVNFHNPNAEHAAIVQVVDLMRKMDDIGKARALKHVRLVAEDHIQEHKTNKEQ